MPLFLLFNIKKIKKNFGRSYRHLKTITGIAMCLLFFSSSPALGDLLSLNELIAKTQERYEKTKDLKAQFIQEVTIKSMNKTEREEGTLYVKNPRRMLWSYSKPTAKKLIINPKKAWLYIPDDHAVYLQDSENIYKSKLGVKFLSGIGKLSEDFHIEFSRPEPVDRNGNYLLTLSPKAPEAGVDKLHLTVDKDAFQIIQCSFTDLYGNTTRIRLTDIKINNNLDDKLFNFKPPSGVEVFNMP
ncbi:MAG TPA: outer membrane lipoprotein chaperone LolA [Syntrophales bacterium]|nr:outer membrane lipoprotein chaperone LolA [Syntrophales bacterium]